MNESPSTTITGRAAPEPPSYLFDIRDFLRKNEPEIWNWFLSGEHSAAASQSVQLDLLKSTVRIEAESNPSIYKLAEEAAKALSLNVPITIYQAKQSGQFNASISCDPAHAHLVLQGDLREQLNEEELKAVIGHELGHLLLWSMEEGQFLASSNMLGALAHDPSNQPIYTETLRLFSQYTEVFCDRAALIATGKLEPVVSSLIKIATVVKSVNVKDYLKQAAEIFANDKNERSTQVTHPELYIRARALDLWQSGAPEVESQIERMVQGNLSLDRMDLSRQQHATKLTREILDAIFDPEWMRSAANLSHAKLYFEDYRPGRCNTSRLTRRLKSVERDFMQFVSYLMLDFVTADRELLEPALAHSIGLADAFGIKQTHVDAARKELRLRKKQVQEIEKSAEELAKQATSKFEKTNESNVDSEEQE